MNNRVLYLDILRSFATLAVVMLHISSTLIYGLERGDMNYHICVSYNSLTRWAVPVFIMISGSLFLHPQKELSLKKLYGKYILRLLVAFFAWTLIYSAILDPFCLWIKHIPVESTQLSFIYSYPIHLWFLPMLIGIYMVLPILKAIVKEEKTLNYFLILWFVFSIIAYLPKMATDAIGLLQIQIILGCAGYFLLGYKLSTTVFKVNKWIILSLLIISLASIIIAGNFSSDVEYYFDCMSPIVIILSACVFSVIKQMCRKIVLKKKYCGFSTFFRKDLFGIYLIHPFFNKLLLRPHFLNNLPLIITIPLFTIIVFILSLFAIKVLRKVPIVRYICS